MTKVAEQFDVSGSYLARICTLLNVPRPERGYWAKLEFGKAPPQTPLPPPRPGDPLSWSKETECVPTLKPKVPPPRKTRKKVRIARDQIHGLVRGAKPHFENSRRIDEGSYLKPYKKLLVDVTASQAGLDKALNLANDLFNALESVGYRVVLASADAQLRREHIDEHEIATKPREPWQYGALWSPYRPTVTYVGTVAIGLVVVEMSENVTLRYLNGKYVRESEYVPSRGRYREYSWTTNQDVPSGRMRVVAYSPYPSVTWSTQWQETKKASLQGQIKSIVKSIEAAAPELVARLEEAEREAEIRRQKWLVEEERRRRDEDRERVKQSVVNSKAELRQVIERWSDVVSIECFFAGVEQRALDLADADRRDVLDRLALARAFVGSLDPLEFFRSWKTPEERYTPRYSDNDELREDAE